MAERFDLKAFTYAHRGLWQAGGAPENSLAAFSAAASEGLGIEFDLRPSGDGDIMVFHDPLLDRMTSSSGLFETRPTAELSRLDLQQTAERIPTFDDLLDLWREDLPLLTELKVDGSTDAAAFAARAGERLSSWKGLAAAMSFSEAAVRALPEGLMRGQLVMPTVQTGTDVFDGVVSRAIADGIDYLAIHHTDTARAKARLGDEGQPFVVWTIRSADDLTAARAHGPAIIFESISVELARGSHAP